MICLASIVVCLFAVHCICSSSAFNALLETAVEDFFHCENLPDRAIESNRFIKILDVAKVVGSVFTIPSRKKIGGELLFY